MAKSETQTSSIIQTTRTTPDGLTVCVFHSPRLNLRWKVAYHDGLPYRVGVQLERALQRAKAVDNA